MMRTDFTNLIYLILAVSSVYCTGNEDDVSEKSGKLISTFQIVRFPNDVCVGSNSRNGTCYTSAECSDKGGTSAGSCADGFGVCCTVLISTCGSSSSENNTYWTQASTVATGTCDLTLCPSEDICSIRLDYTKFVISNPSARAARTVTRMFGQVAGSIRSEHLGSTRAGNCLTDSFSIQGASRSSTPPVVCGTNTGYHVYVEADTDRCNKLTFHIGDGVVSTLATTNSRGITAAATRAWDIRAQFIECSSQLLPPAGCTQFFYGDGKYTLYSANWITTDSATSVSTWHLANQHDRMCMRRERGYCIGCFSATSIDDFQLSGSEAVGNHYTAPGGCCGYGTTASSIFGLNTDNLLSLGLGYIGAGNNIFGYGFDCIIIPGAFGSVEVDNNAKPEATQTATLTAQTIIISQMMTMPWPPQICGSEGGIGIGSNTNIEEGAINIEEAQTQTEGFAVGAADAAVELGTATNHSVCTRHVPFTLEFMSDDIDGIGGETGNTEFEKAIHNRGFNLHATQIACS